MEMATASVTVNGVDINELRVEPSTPITVTGHIVDGSGGGAIVQTGNDAFERSAQRARSDVRSSPTRQRRFETI